MATTYLTLENDVLRRINEVTLDTSGDGFATSKKGQARANEAIKNAISENKKDREQSTYNQNTKKQKINEKHVNVTNVKKKSALVSAIQNKRMRRYKEYLYK